jgi:broad specificity phosphatase PhoE
MGKLILVRHGHTPLNAAGKEERLRGWLDIPLDEQGLQEAVETAQRIADYPVTAIYSSDLRRARQTAEILRQQTNAPVTTTDELRPWNLGIFAGQKLQEILPFLNQLNQNPDLPAPSGESFYDFYGRYSRRLTELMNLAEQSSGYIVAVTHVRNLLATRTILEHGDRDRVPVSGGPRTGTLTLVEKEGNAWKLRESSTAPAAATLSFDFKSNFEWSHELTVS